MKNIILTVSFLLAYSISLYSQDIAPGSLFTRTGTTGSLMLQDSNHIIKRNLNKFTLAWNWGDNVPQAINQAFNIGVYHVGGFGTTLDFERATRMGCYRGLSLVAGLTDIYSGSSNGQHTDTNWLCGMAMQFDPTIATPQGGSRFGFRTRQYGTVSGNSYQISSAVTSGTVVLDNPFPDNELINRNSTPNNYIDLNGFTFYLSANLQLLSGGSSGNPADTILKIEAPYSREDVTQANWTTEGYVKFDSIPAPASNTTANSTLPDSRGLVRSCVNGHSTTAVYITRGMLSESTTLTLSSFIMFDKRLDLKHNYFLVNDWAYNDTSTIKHLGMRVTYMGNAGLALRWLRFETPRAQTLFRGYYDALIASAIQHELHNIDSLNSLQSSPDSTTHLHRIYVLDEGPAPFWEAIGYANKLTEGLAVTELGTFNYHTRNGLATQYNSIAACENYWEGSTLTSTIGAEPCFWKPSTVASISGISGGYLSPAVGFRGEIPNILRLSDYETFIGKRTIYGYSALNFATEPPSSLSTADYEASLATNQYTSGRLVQHEEKLYFNYYKNLGSTLFSDKSWWANIWYGQDWNASTGSRYLTDVRIFNYMPEEMRLAVWDAIVLGGKGVFFYRARSEPLNINSDTSQQNASGYGSFVNLENYYFDLPTTCASLTGLALLQHDSLGTDFIESTTNRFGRHDYSMLDTTIKNFDSTCSVYGISNDRFYIGRKSGRLELKKIFDRLNNIGDELLSLRLQAWFGKGFRTFESAAPSFSMDAFRQYVNVSTTGTVFVRPIARAFSNGTPNYEPADSTFYDITLLKSTSANMSDVFYVGALNRRTDPCVIMPITTSLVSTIGTNGTMYLESSTSGCISTTNCIRFLTTDEFDRVCTTGILSPYSQLGAREISLPFNYHESSGLYALLHVQELGGGIDTVIGQNRNLAVKFKPGEGKMFRVTVLHAGSIKPGHLAYSNQRKLACVTTANGSLMYYHLVYEGTSSEHRAIFYTRSLPVSTATASNDENIIWQPSLCLSVNIMSPDEPMSFPPTDCAYPSLVVRHDGSEQKVYVVYSCNGSEFFPPDQPSTLIVENVLPAEAPCDTITGCVDLITATWDTHVIGRAFGHSIDEWGTPTINGSAQGNYYAWSDSLQGIAVGFKSTGNRGNVDSLRYLYWHFATDDCKHPCLNTYSRIANGERECALVWQELEQIYYSRPFLTTTGSIALQNFNRNFGIRWATSPNISMKNLPSDGTIARLSDSACASENRFPVVYRSVESGLYHFASTTGSVFTNDRVFWEGKIPEISSLGRIFYTGIDAEEMTSTQSKNPSQIWHFVQGNMSVRSPFSLGKPDAAQGSVHLNYDGNPDINISDSAYVLSFVMTMNTSSWLWHFPMRYTSKFLTGSTLLNSSSKYGNWSLFQSRYGHLSAKPFLETPNEWRQNRRVFEFGGSGASTSITASAQYYYRTALDSESVTYLTGFHDVADISHGCKTKYSLTMPVADHKDYAFLVAPPVRVPDTTNARIYWFCDTLRTVPFPIGDSTDFSVLAIGSDTSFVKMELVCETTGTRTVLPLAAGSDTSAILLSYTLTNGGWNFYHAEFFRTSTSANYEEDILVGQLPLVGGGYARQSALTNEKAIDLGQASSADGLLISAFPNPTDESISLRIGRNTQTSSKADKVVLRIVNELGIEVQRFSAYSGDVLQMKTDTLPVGIYFVRAESTNSIGTCTFIVRR